METYLILESRRSYFTKPYFCDVLRNIRLPLWSDHDIAGPHRIINKRKLYIKKLRPLTGHKKMSEAYQLNEMYTF